MKRFLAVWLLIFPFLAGAQQPAAPLLHLNRDSLEYSYDLNDNIWRYHTGDAPEMASNDYDDQSWITINPGLWQAEGGKNRANGFNGIAWLRLHFIADSSITGRPLAIRMTQYGASEIYLDGIRIKSFGYISSKDSTEYFDPQSLPFTLLIKEPGPHLLAVRYANYDAVSNLRTYNRGLTGFMMSIGESNQLINSSFRQLLAFSLIFILLFGIFIALALLHMLLFLYYRSGRSNLYFSFFSLSLAGTFFIGYLLRMSNDIDTFNACSYIATFIACLACFSLSGLINELFSKNKLRFKIISVLCLAAMILRFINFEWSLFACLGLICVVAFEAVVVIIAAMFRRVKGAWIVGTGILFFALLMLIILGSAMLFDQFEINDSTPVGRAISLLIAAAILSIPISMSAYLAWNFSMVNKDLKSRLDEVKRLSEKTLEQEQEKKHMLENRKEELEAEVLQRTSEVVEQKQKIEQQHEELKAEKKKSDDLLLNILPSEIAEELKQTGTTEARHFDHVTVLFTDFVNFTQAGEYMSPQELVNELHTCFKTFDDIISRYNIEKIKTIGDAYLAVCGIPVADALHAENVVSAAIEIARFMMARKRDLGEHSFDVRIGIHSGSVVAGIVGVKKFAYDIWGDTVNTAARMEQHSEPGKINISQSTFELVKDKFACTYRGEIKAKNKGALSMYFIEMEPAPSAGDGSAII